jgi:spore germination protein KA
MVVIILLTIAHLVSLESYGQPYLQPIAPFKLKDLKDTFIRVPINNYKTRPGIALPQDVTRGRGNVGK